MEPTHRVIIRPKAYEELERLADYIADNSPDASRRFTHAVTDAMAELRTWPESHPLFQVGLEGPHFEGLRKRSTPGFPNHLIFFRVRDDVVEVLRVLHGARDLPHALEEWPGDAQDATAP